MAKESLSKELLEFIVLCIDSVELIEELLLLHANPEQTWALSQLDAHIRSSAASIELRLSRLIQLGLVSKLDEEPVRFKYAPINEQIAKIGSELVSVYQTRRVEVIELIYTKPMKEIISFSSAFILKGGGKKDG